MRRVEQLMDLSGRVALITGGAGHIGTAIGDALAECGAAIIVLDLEQASCADAAQRIRDRHNTRALALPLDLTDEDALKSVSDTIRADFGRLDILVNCAALVGTSNLRGWMVPFEQQLPDTWRKALEVNLTAPFILAQVCSQVLAESGCGSIINISSIYGMRGPNMSFYEDTEMGLPGAYAASKGGLLQFTRFLSSVLAPDVRANAITLGGIERGQPEAFQKRYVARTPLKRMAKEEDVKGAAVYLASDLSSYVTGQNIVVDGGWTTW